MFERPKSEDHTPEERELSSTKKRESSILSKIESWQQELGGNLLIALVFILGA